MNISFSHTITPMRQFRKTVTRRYGWANIKPAQIMQAVERIQGFKLGEKIKPIHEIQILTTRWEPLDLMLTDLKYGEREVILEGFPELSPQEFVDMLCKINKRRPDELVHRLEFAHLVREKYVIAGQTSIVPARYEYQEDGTLAGIVEGYTRDYILENYRFDFS